MRLRAHTQEAKTKRTLSNVHFGTQIKPTQFQTMCPSMCIHTQTHPLPARERTCRQNPCSPYQASPDQDLTARSGGLSRWTVYRLISYCVNRASRWVDKAKRRSCPISSRRNRTRLPDRSRPKSRKLGKEIIDLSSSVDRIACLDLVIPLRQSHQHGSSTVLKSSLFLRWR